MGVKRNVSPENWELAKKALERVLRELQEDEEAQDIIEVIEMHRKAVLNRIAVGLELLKPGPREKMGTIVIKTYEHKRKKRGVKLRFKALDFAEGEGEGKKKTKKPIWVLSQIGILDGVEGWRFQIEIDLTKQRPQMIKNFFHQQIKSVVIY